MSSAIKFRSILYLIFALFVLTGCEQHEWGCEAWEFEYLEGEEAREALRLYGNALDSV